MSDRPLIGIPCDVRPEARTLAFVFEEYVSAVEAAGGIPLLIPPLSDPAPIGRYLDLVDGLLFVGGEDIDPREYGEEPLASHDPVPDARGAFDLAFARAAVATELPLLGVCYGCQLFAVVTGGTLWQDLPTQVENPLNHGGKFPDLPHHPIEVVGGTRLRTLLGEDRAEVNSAHHQAPKSVGEGWVVSATAPDGVIEALEQTGERFAIGVEWHPELMLQRPEQRRLFEALVEQAGVAQQG